MQLANGERPWAPQDSPDYLCILSQGHPQPPRSRQEFLLLQVGLLNRLVAQADPGELEEGNRCLQNGLDPQFLDSLPPKLLKDPGCPGVLLFGDSLNQYSNLAEWRDQAVDKLHLPPMPLKEALAETEALDLESYLSRLL
jgi:hypothetical protein